MKWAGWYFVAQALAIDLWWAWLLAAPEAMSLFFVHEESSGILRFFAVADGLVLSAGSFVAGILTLRNRPGSRLATAIALGAAAYSTVASIAFNWPIGQRPLADLAMVAMLIGSGWATHVVWGKG